MRISQTGYGLCVVKLRIDTGIYMSLDRVVTIIQFPVITLSGAYKIMWLKLRSSDDHNKTKF